MAGPIDLKFSGGILDRTGFLARGLLEMCMIPFKILLLGLEVYVAKMEDSFIRLTIYVDGT